MLFMSFYATMVCQLLERRPCSFKSDCALRASTVQSRKRRGHLTLPHPVIMLILAIISYHRYIHVRVFVGSSAVQCIGFAVWLL